MRRSRLVSRNKKLCTTKANTQQGLIGNTVEGNALDHPLGIRTLDMVGGMVVDSVVDTVVDTVMVMVMMTTLHRVREVLQVLHFPSWVPLLVVYC
jgi:hypothetical protein